MKKYPIIFDFLIGLVFLLVFIDIIFAILLWVVDSPQIVNNYRNYFIGTIFISAPLISTLSQILSIKYRIEYATESLGFMMLKPSELKKIKKDLDRYNRLERVLETNNIKQEDFDMTLNFLALSQNEKAHFFAKKINANSVVKEGKFWRIYFNGNFELNSIDNFLLYFTDDISEKIKRDVINIEDKVFVVTQEKEQQTLVKLANDKTNRIIAPQMEELTFLLLVNDYRDSRSILIWILSNSLLLKDVSPYQTSSALHSESNFFGRVEIIRDIITKENANYLIVGARQLGKSSIIKALERRYEGSSKVDCYSFTMEDENIVLAMSRALGMEGEPTLDEVVSAIANAPKKSVFLIDEADRFVKHEKEVDYEITEAFRKLSQEGKATFVLTGFWTLYFAVTSDYHSPLKNFGELIKLEGLDHNACRDLMIEPMKRIGVSYESESIVENVIEFCGRRPNLIAITCNEVLKNLGSCIEEVIDENGRPCKRKVIKAESKRITQADIDEVVENSSLEDYLKGWGSMSENEADNRLDRVIIYLTLEKESFRLADIDAWLKEQGKKIDANRIKSSLERLVVGYILQERKKNYSYRVPLFREKLLEDDIEILLDGDLEQL